MPLSRQFDSRRPRIMASAMSPDVKFIKADQAIAFGQMLGHHHQRVRLVLQATQLGVHAAHKGMKVNAYFTANASGRVERVHQEALPRPTPP